MPDDTIVILGAGLLQVPLIDEAHALGLKVIALDQNAEGHGVGEADLFFQVDTYAIPRIEALMAGLRGAGHTPLGVCTAGADVAASVAAAARALGRRHLAYETAKASTDKGVVRCQLSLDADARLHQPAWAIVLQQDIATHLQERPRPVVVKPLRQRASRGVTFLDGPEDVPRALARLDGYVAPGEEVLIEDRKYGTEYSVECLLQDGKALAWNESQRFFDYTDGIPLERGHINPPLVPAATLDAMHTAVLATARAMGVTWGPWKNDLLVDAAGDVWVLECCARLSGGWDCQKTQPLARGVTLMRPLIKQACGWPILPEDITPTRARHAAAAAISLPPGRVRTLPSLPAVLEIWHVLPGDIVPPTLAHNAERAGFAFGVGTGLDAWREAEKAAALLANLAVVEAL